MTEAEGKAASSDEELQAVSLSSSGPEDGQPSALTQSAEERVEAGGVARPESTEEPVEAGGAARPENAEERVEAGGAARSENAEERVEAGGVARPESPEERAAGAVLSAKHDPIYGTLAPDLFKRRKFFVLRPGTLNQGIKDVEALVDKEVDGSIHGIWLMAEVDHWNNEKERIVMITDNSLLIFKYDFVMFNCDQVQRIPLNFVDRLTHGPFSFPKRSILRREGEGVRVFWDRLREPSFTSRWNPFATDYPFNTFTYHPVRNTDDMFTALCDIDNFRVQLLDAAQKAHAIKPVPGKANGVLVLNQQIQIEAYVGLMSFLGNQNKLGYCMARGNLGF
ncbi:tumor protein p63-regulated gene 1 protein [Pleuronectes platessa]|uniref:tumor protein p63-regulated gene 1 protein n=1 Tax=Pleuronectes platessa TaxID=8262 RepID=UPI00232A6317|nr:tumor protein p63-regulated gene 1 protein [Pleuronectes platessa]XP_053287432.1 tumor protein p63-regulated gene 1 protein [Pleuronectes platessa]XP_053287433.1 tumor protein p63-regulated gene 1 protein [Pleuronectes platessa]